ncbi:MAG TPA: glutamate dehydrogenase, partial [Flavobacteriaceae bacterium]
MTLNVKQLALPFIVFININLGYAQLGFSHEIGAIIGPVEFRSDFGSRLNESTNLGNSGIGIGIIHYISFAYSADCNCYTTDTYFNDHFKLRSEISWNYTKLD